MGQKYTIEIRGRNSDACLTTQSSCLCAHGERLSCCCKVVSEGVLETLMTGKRTHGRTTPRVATESQGLERDGWTPAQPGWVPSGSQLVKSRLQVSPEGQAMLLSWHLVEQVSERHEKGWAGWGLRQ